MRKISVILQPSSWRCVLACVLWFAFKGTAQGEFVNVADSGMEAPNGGKFVQFHLLQHLTQKNETYSFFATTTQEASVNLYRRNGRGVQTVVEDTPQLTHVDAMEAGFDRNSTGRTSLYVFGVPRRRIISTGDPLFGSTVTGFGPLEVLANEQGKVVFTYELADGRRGVAATEVEVPEPATLTLLALLGLVPLFFLFVLQRHLAQAPRQQKANQ